MYVCILVETIYIYICSACIYISYREVSVYTYWMEYSYDLTRRPKKSADVLPEFTLFWWFSVLIFSQFWIGLREQINRNPAYFMGTSMVYKYLYITPFMEGIIPFMAIY